MKKKGLLIIFLIYSNILNAQNYPAATFKNPRDTFNYFLKTMKGHKLGDTSALALATKSLNLSEVEEISRRSIGEISAVQLINTLDRLEYIDINQIPTTTRKTSWVYKKKNINLNQDSYPVEISLSISKNGRWLFTPATVRTISTYERFVINRAVVKGVVKLKSWKQEVREKLPTWTGKRSFLLMNGQWLGLFLILLLTMVIEKLIRIYLSYLTTRIMHKKGIEIDEQLKRRLTFPVGLLSFALIWMYSIPLLELGDGILSFTLRVGKVTSTIASIMVIYQLVELISDFLQKRADRSENKFDDILIPLLRKSAKTFIIAIGIIAIGDSLNIDMKGIIAGMGIVGLGVSLAAKDTISNLFGSLTVLLDRPFQIGDWVKIDNDLEGTIEEVGLRSCRIRTFYDSLITLPNGRLTNAHIDNYGKRTYRRFTTNIGVQYDTPPQKINDFCEGIRNIILKSPNTRKDSFHVYMNGMGSSSLDILLYVFFTVPTWSEELEEKHRLLNNIILLGKELDISFAFPTRTVHLYNSNPMTKENEKLPESTLS